MMDEYQRKIHLLGQSAFKKPHEMQQGGGRRLYFWSLIGANRTGKTTTEIEMAKSWRQGNPRKRVIAFDDQGFLKKAGVVDIDIPLKLMKEYPKILSERNGKEFEGMGGAKEFKYGDCLLILDDFRRIQKNSC